MREIKETLYETALAFMEEHKEDFEGVAVAYTNENEVLTSVELFCVPFSACLCAEVGTIFEAIKKKQRITHILCLQWDNEEETSEIAAPCGSCLDRLLKYGDGVKIALDIGNNEIDFFEIADLLPANWYSMAKENDISDIDNETIEHEEEASDECE